MPTQTKPISAPQRRSFRDLSGKLLTIVVILAMLILLAADGVRYLGSLVPFGLERSMALPYAVELPKPDAVAQALNAFAEKIAIAQGLPHEIPVQIHLLGQDWVQAFATLGGHILVYKGLLKEVKSEDELAAVLAHEIAHLKHRHPTEALGRRVNLALLLSVISQDLAAQIAAPSFGAGLRTAPHFTRDQEQEALISTGAALAAMYGHLGGALDLGTTLRRLIARTPTTPPALVSTHPGLERTGDSLQPLALERDWKLDEPDKQRRALPHWLGITPPAIPVAPVDAQLPPPEPAAPR